MQRREFIQHSATLAGAAALTGWNAGTVAEAQAPTPAARRPPDPPAPISESERIARREKAQALMKQLGVSAMLIEPGANMNYFTGMEWGRSERLFAFLLPQTGKGIVVSPAFEEQRGADQVGGRFEMRVWQEDENPESVVAGVLKDWGASTGKLAIDGSARTFVYNAMAMAAPGLQLATAEAITNACRGVKTAHEIEIMRYATPSPSTPTVTRSRPSASG